MKFLSYPRVLVMLIVLAAFALRVFHLGAQAIWWDESLSLYRATRDLPTILANTILIQKVVTTDLQPPLYFLLLHFGVGALGTSEFALRFISVMATVGSVPLLYTLGRRMFSPAIGVLTALLGAGSPFYIWFAQEARPYALVLFWSLLGMYALVRALGADVIARSTLATLRVNSATKQSPLPRPPLSKVADRKSRDPQRDPATPNGGRDGWVWRLFRHPGARNDMVANWALLYEFSTIAALYTSYYAAFLLPFHALYILLYSWRDAAARKLLLLPALPALSMILLLPIITRGAAGNVNSGPAFVPLDVILRDLLNSFSIGVTLDAPLATGIDAALLVLFVLGIFVRTNKSRIALVAFLLVPTLVLYAASFIRPLYQNSRYLIAWSPAFYLGAALGVDVLARWRRYAAVPALAIIMLGAMLSLNNLYFNPRYGKDDHRAWAESLRERVHPNDFLILDSPHTEALFNYYASSIVPYTTLPILSDFGSPATAFAADRAAVRQALTQNERVWFLSMHAPFDDPEGRIEKLLSQEGVLLDHANFRGTSTEIALSLYAASLPTAMVSDIAHPLNLLFDSRLRLLGWDAPKEMRSEKRDVVKLYWQLDEPAGEDYGVSLRAIDKTGKRVGQWDAVPVGNRAASSTWTIKTIVVDAHDLPIEPGTPPGNYRLQLQVYHPATGNGIGDALILGEIAITQ